MLASGSGTILDAMAGRRPADRRSSWSTGRARRSRRRHGDSVRRRRAQRLRPRASTGTPTPSRSSTPCTGRRSTWWPWPGSARSSAAPRFEAFPGHILNTHPALLPSFPGWHGVRDALAYGVKVTGCTVHVATDAVDAGPILAQEAVTVLPGDDTVESLHERIKAVERRLYTDTIADDPRRGPCPHVTDQKPCRRALLSVYDKTGVVELADGPGRPRLGAGVERGHGQGASPRPASPSPTWPTLTGFPTMLGHRVVTLHPIIHGGILADRDQPRPRGRHRGLRHRPRSTWSWPTSTRSPAIPRSS